MVCVVYSCPFIPAEWITSHGLNASRITPSIDMIAPYRTGEGICPYVIRFINHILVNQPYAVIITTVCDQMRRGADWIEIESDIPVFLFNVPSTWQTRQATGLYSDELKRLGRFLVRLGGTVPSSDELKRIMKQYDRVRMRFRNTWDKIPPRVYAEKLSELHRDGPGSIRLQRKPSNLDGIPLALLGGPLPESDFFIFDIIEESGGRVVLNGTENGERTLPDKFDLKNMEDDPFKELVRAYFGSIPDVSRRPNTALYQWLKREVEQRGIKGIIVRYYSWCDLWHGEVQRLKDLNLCPVAAINISGSEPGAIEHITTRIEAFIEQLL